MLSLPWAFAHTGLVLGPLLLIACALMSDFTICILVVCARRVGAETFEQLAGHAFGDAGRLLTVVVIILLTWLSGVAYVVLIGDLLTPIVRCVIAPAGPAWPHLRLAVQLSAAVVITPLATMRTMHGLRYTSILSVCAVLTLGVCVGMRSLRERDTESPVQLWPDTWSGTLEGMAKAMPIFTVSYLCHFNVLATHRSVCGRARARAQR